MDFRRKACSASSVRKQENKIDQETSNVFISKNRPFSHSEKNQNRTVFRNILQNF